MRRVTPAQQGGLSNPVADMDKIVQCKAPGFAKVQLKHFLDQAEAARQKVSGSGSQDSSNSECDRKGFGCSQVLHNEFPAERLISLEGLAHNMHRLPIHPLVWRLAVQMKSLRMQKQP